MPKRTYGQRCSLAYAVDLLGERWTLLIFRELLIQPQRYRDLLRHLDGIGTNLLSQRLRELEEAGLVERVDDSRQSPYRLTQAGRDLEPAILELIRWGYRRAIDGEDDLHREHWDLLAMKAFFVPERCTRPLTLQFASEPLTAWVRISPHGFEHGFGEAAEADIVVAGTVGDLRMRGAAAVTRGAQGLAGFTAAFELPDGEIIGPE